MALKAVSYLIVLLITDQKSLQVLKMIQQWPYENVDIILITILVT